MLLLQQCGGIVFQSEKMYFWVDIAEDMKNVGLLLNLKLCFSDGFSIICGVIFQKAIEIQCTESPKKLVTINSNYTISRASSSPFHNVGVPKIPEGKNKNGPVLRHIATWIVNTLNQPGKLKIAQLNMKPASSWH